MLLQPGAQGAELASPLLGMIRNFPRYCVQLWAGFLVCPKTTSILMWTERTQLKWNEMSLQNLSIIFVDCSSGLHRISCCFLG